MAKIAAGDRLAFAALFERHGGRVEGFLRRSLPPTAAAEVTQEVFLRVWRHAARYDRAKASPTTWLFSIARNARTDRQRRRARPEPDPDDPMWVPSAPVAPDTRAHRAARDATLKARVHSLPPKQRQVIELAYLEGLTLSEIAERLAVPLGTVKSRVRLAMGRLRDDPEVATLDPDA
jgi:RNA polymerase sigma-70 factor (ECF subfamily)